MGFVFLFSRYKHYFILFFSFNFFYLVSIENRIVYTHILINNKNTISLSVKPFIYLCSWGSSSSIPFANTCFAQVYRGGHACQLVIAMKQDPASKWPGIVQSWWESLTAGYMKLLKGTLSVLSLLVFKRLVIFSFRYASLILS